MSIKILTEVNGCGKEKPGLRLVNNRYNHHHNNARDNQRQQYCN
jgi:hypothetical protein